jgi:enterochelin esterase-like enzyme
LPSAWAPAADSSFTVVVRYPATTKKLFLRGTAAGLTWDAGVQMTRTYDTAWQLSLPGQSAERVEYKVLLDDSQWAVGANAAATLATGETNVSYYPWFGSQTGRHESVRNVVCEKCGAGATVRDVVVWLPPSFDENPLAVYADVLVMQDGENVFNDSTAFGGRSWRAGPTLDDEVGSGRIREALVVAVDNTARRIDEYTYIADPQHAQRESSSQSPDAAHPG